MIRILPDFVGCKAKGLFRQLAEQPSDMFATKMIIYRRPVLQHRRVF